MTQTDEPKYFNVSWDEFHRAARLLAAQLMHKGEWKGIVAITRGGLVPAAIIARELGIHLIESFCVSSYDHDNQRTAHILKNPNMAGDGEGWLVIDDLSDSGNTFKIAREIMPKAYQACVYAKPKGKNIPDMYVQDIEQDTWINFPWDMAPVYVPPISGRN